MKFLLVLVVVLAILWLLRGNRRGETAQRRPSGTAPQQQQQEMVQCPVCGVHLPRSDALPGPGGRLFCCAEHRAAAEV